MREIDMGAQAGGNSMTPNERRRREILDQFRKLGAEAAIPTLVQGLGDSVVKLRGNAALTLLALAKGTPSQGVPGMDIRAAIPALTKVVGDVADRQVPAWAGQALGAMGATAKEAVPVLIEYLKSPSVGVRQGSCHALGGIGPSAREGLPALRELEKDPDEYVRRFAALAVTSIQGEGER